MDRFGAGSGRAGGEVRRRLGTAPDVPNGGAGPRLSAGSLRGFAGGPLVQRYATDFCV